MLLLLTTALAADPAPILCCDDPVVRQTLDQYLRLYDAVIGRKNTPTGILYAWDGKAQAAVDRFEGPERESLAQIATLTRDLKAKKASEVIERFEDFSRLVIPLVLRHPGGDLELFEAHCEGRPWLQKSREVTSPYGDCGVLGHPQ